MSCREVYQKEVMFSISQMQQGQRKGPQNTEKLDAIEDKQDCSQFVEDMDLFSLIEEGLSETDRYQGPENTTPNGEILKTCNVDNTVPIDEDNGNASFYNDNKQFHQDYPPTPRMKIFSPWFSDPLLSSDIPPLATRDNIKIINSYKKSNQTKDSHLRYSVI